MNVYTQLAVEANTKDFSIHCMNRLKEIMYVGQYQEGSNVFWEGDVNNSLYYLLDGKVKLTKLNESGKDLTLSLYFPGDLFGEYDATNIQSNSFSAQVIEYSEVGVIQQNELEILLKQDMELAAEFTQWQSQIRRYVQLKLRDLLLYGKNGALASILVRAANTYGIQRGNTILITEKFTNYDLANLIGATRETVNRLLSVFKKDGLIQTANGRIEILDITALKEINRCEKCPIELCRL